jgi:ribosomal protein S1
VGEEVSVKVLGKNQAADSLLMMVLSFSAETVKEPQAACSDEIQKGTIVQGKITSVKGQFAYVRINQSRLVMGRLHQTESPQFKDLFAGERIRCKVLQVQDTQ